MKHNKKRNTAFLYESLIKELTKSIVKKDNNRKVAIIKILKENFGSGKVLAKELKIYNSILNNQDEMTSDFSSRLLEETKKDFYGLDRKMIFNKQTKLIESINKELSNSVFGNFVPNYKNIATVGQWFASGNLDAKSRLLIETKVLGILTPEEKPDEAMRHIDNLTYRTFVKKFNETYDKTLGEKQKTLLVNFITSFSDNGLMLKTFMNEEIGRLKTELGSLISLNESKFDDQKLTSSRKVLIKLNDFKKRPIDEEMVRTLFYIQDLVGELSHGN
jgi:hypothetical protein